LFLFVCCFLTFFILFFSFFLSFMCELTTQRCGLDSLTGMNARS
jgi:hypothetical protein